MRKDNDTKEEAYVKASLQAAANDAIRQMLGKLANESAEAAPYMALPASLTGYMIIGTVDQHRALTRCHVMGTKGYLPKVKRQKGPDPS